MKGPADDIQQATFSRDKQTATMNLHGRTCSWEYVFKHRFTNNETLANSVDLEKRRLTYLHHLLSRKSYFTHLANTIVNG